MKLLLWPFLIIYKHIHYNIPIEASRYSFERIRFIKRMLYIFAPIGILVICFGFYLEASELGYLNWSTIFVGGGCILFLIGLMYLAYIAIKGYENRASVSDEEYANLIYKPVSDVYLFYSIAAGFTFAMLNKYYLHWF